jgi:hypothetical protein
MPLRFLTQELPLDILEHLLTCMEQQVAFNNRALLTALAKDVQIIRIEKTHFADAAGRTTLDHPGADRPGEKPSVRRSSC